MIRQLDVPIYDTNILFLLETTAEEFTEFLDNKKNKQKISDETIKEIFDDIADKRWGGTVWRVDNNSAYICLIKEANKIFYNTHELFHLADSILKDRGVEYTENNEALAYMVGWLNEQYSCVLNELKPKRYPTEEQIMQLAHLIGRCSCDAEVVEELKKQLYGITRENLSAEEHND